MGNDLPGDGAKYIGRGAIQVTGKDNYKMIRDRIGIDVVKEPELLERPEVAARASLVWWENRKRESKFFREAIQNGDMKGVTKVVNGGDNGLTDRMKRYKKILVEINNRDVE